MKQLDRIAVWSRRNWRKSRNRNSSTRIATSESCSRSINSKRKSMPKKPIWSRNTTNIRKRIRKSRTSPRKSRNLDLISPRRKKKPRNIAVKSKSFMPSSRKPSIRNRNSRNNMISLSLNAIYSELNSSNAVLKPTYSTKKSKSITPHSPKANLSITKRLFKSINRKNKSLSS